MGEKTRLELMRDLLVIDSTKLDEELERQASNYLYVAEQAIGAEAEYEEYKAMLGQLEAELDSKIRVAAEAAGKKLTEAAISMQINREDAHKKANRHLIKLRQRREVLKALRESWYMRKDMLIQRAIKARSEIEALTSETVKKAA
jgi:hypothetical protein